MDGRRDARIDSITGGTRVVHLTPVQMRGSSTVRAAEGGVPCAYGLQELQQQHGGEDDETAVPESSHQANTQGSGIIQSSEFRASTDGWSGLANEVCKRGTYPRESR
ncbi:unnamed protein product [Miscanthus lutarioriparius]|uniref:Uncharacterized protein n=1 Tax=Miscanthus lutarioriparius TaxID=422564 RepID=A0A811MVP4_9POAL|nr:unnamed protein product [Miscanthus lutarioriparius]